LIRSLERRNIPIRIPNSADGRSKRVYLTSKGKGYQNALIQIAPKSQPKENLPWLVEYGIGGSNQPSDL
jgi:DNA-binding MarR family transcriptional regulator